MKMTWLLRFDRRTRWTLITSRRVLLTITLELGILTSLHITVMLSQRLKKTVLAYYSHLNIPIIKIKGAHS